MNTGGSKETQRRKYDGIASAYSARYADPGAVARHQVALVERWGRRVGPGDSVLEVGCADGLVTEALAAAGFVVTAVDLSPRMVEVARQRLGRNGLGAEVVVADVDNLDLGRCFDAVLVVMWSFFAYASHPQATLERLAAHTRGKLLVDANPRAIPVRTAAAAVTAAGFDKVAWRSLLIPQRHRLPIPALRVLAATERVPVARAIPLRWAGNIVIKGERRSQR